MTLRKYLYIGNTLTIDLSGTALSRGSLVAAHLSSLFYNAYIPQVAEKVLDLGCGTAPLEDFLASITLDLTKCDWPNSLHSTNVDVEADISKGLPFSDESFDLIILSDVLEHIYTPHFLLREIRRILKPGGLLLGNSPFIYLLHEEPYDYFRFTKHFYTKSFHDIGFSSFELVSFGASFELALDCVMKLTNKCKLGLMNVFIYYLVKRFIRLIDVTGCSAPKMSLAYGFKAVK